MHPAVVPQAGGGFPLAYLAKEVAARLGAITQLVALSEDSLAKQRKHHPEILQEEYAMVQATIDRGMEVPGNQANTSVYVLDEENGYVTMLKVTREEEIRRLLRKGK